MKQIIQLQDWSLIQVIPDKGFEYSFDQALKGENINIGKPVTAMEALIAAGKISGSLLEDGEAAYCKWVAENDWLYTCVFTRPKTSGKIFLCFKGLDTDCDIWLNGEKIAEHHTMYLPLRLDIGIRVKSENNLAVYFHSPVKLYYWYKENMPEKWKGTVQPFALLRKPPCDFFRDYLGVQPHFTPVGFFDDVCLELVDMAELGDVSVNYYIHHDLSSLEVILNAEVLLYPSAGKNKDRKAAAEVEFALYDPKDAIVFRRRIFVENGDDVVCRESFVINNPELWWPIGYGPQAVYTAVFTLYADGVEQDQARCQTGFRRVEVVGSLKFRINGIVVRFWGGNIATMGNISHRPNPGLAHFLLEKAVSCNHNTLRVWGPGEPVCDEFYNEADRLGIMIWQDFFIEPSQLPDTPEYTALFAAEAEYLIRRLRNHPSVILWCGSNESLHMNDFFRQTEKVGVENLLMNVFPKLCKELDPDRYYHASCPCDGLFPNDPGYGDTHGSHCMMSYLPGEEYANFFSEDIVTTPPELKSLKRFVSENEIWPEGFSDLAVYGRRTCFPPALERRTNNYSREKLGPIERFYDAVDAESLIYKYAAAAGYSYYYNIVKLRRGKPASDCAGDRRSNGHLVWKFNNTWPQFYCGLVDYYGESHIPYYSVRRAFAPFLIHFDIGDHIYVWGVNDTPKDISGILTVKIFRLSENKVIKTFSCPGAVLQGQSSIITNLDVLSYFRRDCVLFAVFECGDIQFGRAVDFVDLERNIPFPQAELSLKFTGDKLEISTDSFARCVELSGITRDGDEFGWHFEDNYFDLFPFETVSIRISGRHQAGFIHAKAHYSQKTTVIEFK
jgi:hypothetical protein